MLYYIVVEKSVGHLVASLLNGRHMAEKNHFPFFLLTSYASNDQ
jgi:hypothetical protein